jgi:riboflavin kinase
MKLGASKTSIRISTTDLSSIMGGSQQSASRHLQLLESEGLLERSTDSNGTKVRINHKGVAELDYVLQELKWHLEGKEANAIEIEGIVISGLFEGAYYIAKEGYLHQIQEKLGFKPFLGTLNVRIANEDLEKRHRVEKGSSIQLEGFKNGERSFGGARCYPLTVNDEADGALIVADRSIHDENVLEVISPLYLRRQLRLADGDKVKLSFLPLRRSDS